MASKYLLLPASIAYTAALLYFSVLPSTGTGAACPSPSGSIVHFIAFAVYSIILVLAFSKVTSSKKATLFSLAVAILIGLVAELLQLYAPGRVCDAFDWLVDVFGALAGLFVLILLNKGLRKIKRGKA